MHPVYRDTRPTSVGHHPLIMVFMARHRYGDKLPASSETVVIFCGDAYAHRGEILTFAEIPLGQMHGTSPQWIWKKSFSRAFWTTTTPTACPCPRCRRWRCRYGGSCKTPMSRPLRSRRSSTPTLFCRRVC